MIFSKLLERSGSLYLRKQLGTTEQWPKKESVRCKSRELIATICQLAMLPTAAKKKKLGPLGFELDLSDTGLRKCSVGLSIDPNFIFHFNTGAMLCHEYTGQQYRAAGS